MVRKRQDLFERAEAELYTLGGEISKRKSADAVGAGLTAEMRAARAMLRAGLEYHGKQARTLSLKMLTGTVHSSHAEGRLFLILASGDERHFVLRRIRV